MIGEIRVKCKLPPVLYRNLFIFAVTAVENASQALYVLSSRKDEIDIMLVNIHLLDMDPTKLLHMTAAMNLVTGKLNICTCT